MAVNTENLFHSTTNRTGRTVNTDIVVYAPLGKVEDTVTVAKYDGSDVTFLTADDYTLDVQDPNNPVESGSSYFTLTVRLTTALKTTDLLMVWRETVLPGVTYQDGGEDRRLAAVNSLIDGIAGLDADVKASIKDILEKEREEGLSLLLTRMSAFVRDVEHRLTQCVRIANLQSIQAGDGDIGTENPIVSEPNKLIGLDSDGKPVLHDLGDVEQTLENLANLDLTPETIMALANAVTDVTLLGNVLTIVKSGEDGTVDLQDADFYDNITTVEGKVESLETSYPFSKLTGHIAGTQIQDGSIAGTKLAGNSVRKEELAPGAVDESELATDAVTGDKIKGKAVTEAKLADAVVTTLKKGVKSVKFDATTRILTLTRTDDTTATVTIPGGSGGSATLDDLSVTKAKLATALKKEVVASVTKSGNNLQITNLNGDTPTSIALPAGAGSLTLDDDGVTTAKIADGAVTHPKLATDAVEKDNIKNGEVGTDELSGAVTGELAKIPNHTDRLVALEGSTVKVPANKVVTTSITDLSVTAGKIGSDAVETGKIKNLAVTKGKLSTAVQGELADAITGLTFNPGTRTLTGTQNDGGTSEVVIPGGGGGGGGGDADPDKFLTYGKLLPQRSEVNEGMIFMDALKKFFKATKSSKIGVPFEIGIEEVTLGNNAGSYVGYCTDRDSGFPVSGEIFHMPLYNEVESSPQSGVRFPTGAGPGSAVQPVPSDTTQRGPYVQRRNNRNPDDSLNTGTEVGVAALTTVYSGVVQIVATISDISMNSDNEIFTNDQFTSPYVTPLTENPVDLSSSLQIDVDMVLSMEFTFASASGVQFDLLRNGEYLSVPSVPAATSSTTEITLKKGDYLVIYSSGVAGDTVDLTITADNTISAVFTTRYEGIQTEFEDENQEILEFNSEIDYDDENITKYLQLLEANKAAKAAGREFIITKDQYVGTAPGQVYYQTDVDTGGGNELVFAQTGDGLFFAVDTDGAIAPHEDFDLLMELDRIKMSATANLNFGLYEVDSDGNKVGGAVESLGSESYADGDSVSFDAPVKSGKLYKIFEDLGASELTSVGGIRLGHNEFRQIWHPELIEQEGWSPVISDREKAIEAEFHTLQEDVEGLHKEVSSLTNRPTILDENRTPTSLEDKDIEEVLELPRADSADAPDFAVLARRARGGTRLGEVRTEYAQESDGRLAITTPTGTNINLPYGTGINTQLFDGVISNDPSIIEILQPLASAEFIIRQMQSLAPDSSSRPVNVTVKMFLKTADDSNFVEIRQHTFNTGSLVSHPGDEDGTTALARGDVGFGSIVNLKRGDQIAFDITFNTDPAQGSAVFHYGRLDIVATNRQHLRSIEDVPAWNIDNSSFTLPFNAADSNIPAVNSSIGRYISVGGSNHHAKGDPISPTSSILTSDLDTSAIVEPTFQNTFVTLTLSNFMNTNGRINSNQRFMIYEYIDPSTPPTVQVVSVLLPRQNNRNNDLGQTLTVAYRAEVGKRYVLYVNVPPSHVGDSAITSCDVKVDATLQNYPDFTAQSNDLSGDSVSFSGSETNAQEGSSMRAGYAVQFGTQPTLSSNKFWDFVDTKTFTAKRNGNLRIRLTVAQSSASDLPGQVIFLVSRPDTVVTAVSDPFTIPGNGSIDVVFDAPIAAGVSYWILISNRATLTLPHTWETRDVRYPEGVPPNLLAPRNFVQNPHLFQRTRLENPGELIANFETITSGNTTYTGFSRGGSLGNDIPDFGNVIANIGADSIKTFCCWNDGTGWKVRLTADSEMNWDLYLAYAAWRFLSLGGNLMHDNNAGTPPEVSNPLRLHPENLIQTGNNAHMRDLADSNNTIGTIRLNPNFPGPTINTVPTHNFEFIVQGNTNIFAKFDGKRVGVIWSHLFNRDIIMHPQMHSWTSIDGDHPSQSESWRRLALSISRLNAQKALLNSIIDAAAQASSNNDMRSRLAALTKL